MPAGTWPCSGAGRHDRRRLRSGRSELFFLAGQLHDWPFVDKPRHDLDARRRHDCRFQRVAVTLSSAVSVAGSNPLNVYLGNGATLQVPSAALNAVENLAGEYLADAAIAFDGGTLEPTGGSR